MEGSKVGKRTTLDDSDARSLEPILVKIDKSGYAPHDIRIDKNEVLMNVNYASSLTKLRYYSLDLFNLFSTVQNRSWKGQR